MYTPAHALQVAVWVILVMWLSKVSDAHLVFGIACGATALTMFALGAVQARITKQNVCRAGLIMMMNGSLAAAAAYLVGWGIEAAIGRGGLC